MRGEKASELTVIGECDESDTGTIITFLPDDEIFDAIDYDYATLNDRLRELAFLNKGLKITLKDERPVVNALFTRRRAGHQSALYQKPFRDFQEILIEPGAGPNPNFRTGRLSAGGNKAFVGVSPGSSGKIPRSDTTSGVGLIV